MQVNPFYICFWGLWEIAQGGVEGSDRFLLTKTLPVPSVAAVARYLVSRLNSSRCSARYAALSYA